MIFKASIRIITMMLLCLVHTTTHAEGKARYEKHVVKLPTGEREFYIYIPASIPKDRKAPAVITFHGFKSDANGMRWLINSDKIADKYGFIMVYPNAINKSWNVGRGSGTIPSKVDDISYASALVDVIKARFPVDPQRVYAMGFSNGAQMVAAMACRVSGKLAAGGMVAHSMNIQPCEPNHKLPIAMIHGAKDPYARFDGGGQGNIASWKESLSFFRQVHEIGGEGKTILDKPTARCRNWAKDDKKPLVVGCVALDGGHNWPGGLDFEVKRFGKVNREINATDFLFSFFSKHQGKPAPRDKSKKIAMKFPPEPGKKAAGKDKKKTASNQDGNKQVAAKPANGKKAQSAASTKAKSGPELQWREQKDGKETYKFAFYSPQVLPTDATTRIVAVLGPQAVGPDGLARIFSVDEYASPWRAVHVFLPLDPWKKPGRDAGRVVKAMERVAAELNLIAPEMSVVAWSDGGRIAEEMYCSQTVDLTSMVLVGYGWRQPECDTPITLPVMLVHSKEDKRHPYRGDEKKKVQPFKALVKRFQNRLGGGFTRKSIKAGKDHRCDRYLDLMKTTELSVCTVDWGGNTVPGTKFKFPKEFGNVMGSLKIVPLTYAFLGRHRYHGFTTVHQR